MATQCKTNETGSSGNAIANNATRTPTTLTKAPSSDWLQLAIAGCIGGATAGVVADGVLYAVDSAKVQAQSKAQFAPRMLLRGLVPSLAFGTVPSFGVFFFLYAPLRDVSPLASAACAIPATLVGIPADVIKKRLVLGLDASVTAAARHAIQQTGLFAGWHVNLVRDIPFAVIKLSFYETLARQYRAWYQQTVISATGASICGIVSGVGCAIVTCPLDVINTRIKSGDAQTTSIRKAAAQLIRSEGVSSLFRGVALRSLIMGVGSSIFWPIQTYVSQAIYVPPR